MNRAVPELFVPASGVRASQGALTGIGLAVLATGVVAWAWHAKAHRNLRLPGVVRADVAPVLAVRTARRMETGAATLALSVLADSALEHFRGGLYNPAMFVAPTAAACTLASAVAAARNPPADSRRRRATFLAAALVGLAGFGFHLYNVSRQTGGWSWLNLFHKAPVGAPMALNVAGLLGLVGTRVARSRDPAHQRILGLPAGRLVALGTAGALVGTSAEAALLHFRGAFQNRYMYLPVTLPPLAALALAGAATSGSPLLQRIARALLRATALLGLLGTGFHARGVARRMGGWCNWSQNLQQGPPLPAPPSFTGLSLAGLAALDLLAQRRRG